MTPNASWDQCKALAEKFTPGPWFVDPLNLGLVGDISTAAGDTIAQAQQKRSYLQGPDEERNANARLIAAAPELLEALEWALAEIRSATRYDDEAQFWNCYDMARAAIAKARGQS